MDILLTLGEIGAVILIAFGLNLLISLGLNVLTTRWLHQTPDRLMALSRKLRLLLQLTCMGLCLLVAGANGWLMYQGKNVVAVQLGLLRSIPPQYWTTLAVTLVKCISLLVLLKLLLPYLHRALDWACTTTKNSDHITANDDSIQKFFDVLKRVLTHTTWIGGGILCTLFLQLPNIVPHYLFIALKAYFIFSVGKLLILALSAIIDTLDAWRN